jgi:hypothetical protein
MTHGARYQFFGRNYQVRGRPASHLKSIARVNRALPRKEDAMFKTIVAAIALLTTIGTTQADALQFSRESAGGNDVIIKLNGIIEPGDGNRLAEYLERIGHRPGERLRLSLNSPGGDAQEAYEMAGSLKFGPVTTIVTGRARCLSACFLLFIGGQDRFAGTHAQIGIHSAANQNGVETQASYVATMRIARRAAEWGVPQALIGKLVATPASGMAVLTKNELRSLNVHILPELDAVAP